MFNKIQKLKAHAKTSPLCHFGTLFIRVIPHSLENTLVKYTQITNGFF